jgi:hypothetical protein
MVRDVPATELSVAKHCGWSIGKDLRPVHVADLTKVVPGAVLWQFRQVVGKKNRQCNMDSADLAPLT